MFNNPGKKLKGIAKVVFWLVTIAVIVTSGRLFLVSSGGYQRGTFEMLIGIVVIVFGILGAWLLSIGLYAAGEAVEDIHAIRENLYMRKRKDRPTPADLTSAVPSNEQSGQAYTAPSAYA